MLALPRSAALKGEGGQGRELSPAERRFWLLDRLVGAGRRYTITEGWWLRAPLDVDVISRSLGLVASRHDVFRTAYRLTPDGPRAFSTARPPIALKISEMDGRTTGERVRQARARGLAMQRAPFDLENGPLLRAGLLRLSVEDHVLLLVAHHIVLDGWSMSVVRDEIGRAYRSIRHGELPDLGPAARYRDAMDKRRQRLLDGGTGPQDYWDRQLSGVPVVNELPLDRPRPVAPALAVSELTTSMPRATSLELAARAERLRVTPFVLLLTAFIALIYRWSGRSEVVVGVPAAGREEDDQHLVGCFLNTLPVRVQVPSDPTFAELLELVQCTVLDALAHQDLPIEAMVESLGFPGHPSRNPLVQLSFNMLNYPESPLRLDGVQVRPFKVPRSSALFDVALYVHERDARLGFQLVFDRALFQLPRMRAFLDQYMQLLEAASARPNESLLKHSLVTARTRAVLPDPTRQLDSTWVGPIHNLFERAVATGPEAPAIVAGNHTWTYGDCLRITREVAGGLRAAGVRSGDVVAILADRSWRVPMALLATCEAGAAFLLLDTSHPAERLWRLLSHAGAVTLLLAAETTAASARDVLSRWISLKPERPPIVVSDTGVGLVDLPAVPVGPDDLAYVAYTSGSTGIPRGVLGRHGSLTHFLPWLRDEFELTAADRFSMLAGLGHDPLHREVFTPLAIGASVHVPPPEVPRVPDRLARWILDSGVTVAHFTPGVLRLVVAGMAGVHPGRTSLRLAFCVGDVLTWRDVKSFSRISATGAGIVALYGTTETQRAVGWALPGWRDPRAATLREPRSGQGVVPLGWGVPDVQLLVLNPAGQLAGVGELGEIAVRSPHLALGYLDEPAATAERFTVNPMGADPQDCVYRTGDLGRYQPDGAVEFAGRRDRQVQMHGFRIDPAEIEASIRSHPAVRDVVVLPGTDDGRGSGLTAYVVPSLGGSLSDLAPLLRTRLPAPLVPGRLLEVAVIPLTPNGKVDEEALRRHAATPVKGAGPGGGTVRQMLEALWREVAGAETDFGTSSLAMVQLHVRLEAVLGRRIDIVELFRHQDLDSLAGAIAADDAGVEMRRSSP